MKNRTSNTFETNIVTSHKFKLSFPKIIEIGPESVSELKD